MRVCALLIAGLIVACDSAEPSDGLMARLEKERRAEMEAELQRRVHAEKQRLARELEIERNRSGLTITLPKGAAGEIDVAKLSLVVDVPVSGDVYVAGKAMRDEDLDNLFRAAFARDDTTQVVIRADKGVPHGRVVGIMERAKAAGLTRLAIGTAPASQSP